LPLLLLLNRMPTFDAEMRCWLLLARRGALHAAWLLGDWPVLLGSSWCCCWIELHCIMITL
jgi:hypothetical protein